MEVVDYYASTLMNAFKTLGPYAAFLVGGYFVFVKMPFLFLRKSMHEQKKKMSEEEKGISIQEKYSVEDYKKFQQRLKLMNGEPQTKKEQLKEERKEEKKKEEKKEIPKRPAPRPQVKNPEEIFNFKPGESFSQSELKKRYFELLKQNHPDRVASMGDDFKKLAEKNSKEINQAYEQLKNKAS